MPLSLRTFALTATLLTAGPAVAAAQGATTTNTNGAPPAPLAGHTTQPADSLSLSSHSGTQTTPTRLLQRTQKPKAKPKTKRGRKPARGGRNKCLPKSVTGKPYANKCKYAEFYGPRTPKWVFDFRRDGSVVYTRKDLAGKPKKVRKKLLGKPKKYRLSEYFWLAGKEYRVDPALIAALVFQETRADPGYAFTLSKSIFKDTGIGQFILSTAIYVRQLNNKLFKGQLGSLVRTGKKQDPRFNPEKSAYAIAFYLRHLYNIHGSTWKALRAYNGRGSYATEVYARYQGYIAGRDPAIRKKFVVK